MNTNPFSTPIIQLFDDNGLPLAGGLVYTYIAGTTTPQPTYASADGLTPNTNPLVLDAAGRGQIWLSATQSYRIVVTDANNTPVSGLDADNVSAPYAQGGSSGGGGGGSTTPTGFVNVKDYIPQALWAVTNSNDMAGYFSQASVAASLIAAALLVPNNTYYFSTNPTLSQPVYLSPGAILRAPGIVLAIDPIITDSNPHFILTTNLTFNSKRPVDILPEWFGALGDGVTDDSTPISQAINSTAVGQRVLFDSVKTYSTGNIILKSGITIEGSARINMPGTPTISALKFNQTSGAMFALTNSAVGGLQGVTIKNLTMDFASVASPGILLDTSDSLIEDCEFVNGSTGIQFEGQTTLSTRNIVRNCIFNTMGTAIYNTSADIQCAGGSILNNQFIGCTNAVELGYPVGWKIDGNSFSTCKYSIAVNGSGFVISNNLIKDVGVIVGSAGVGAGISVVADDADMGDVVYNHITQATIDNTIGISIQVQSSKTGKYINVSNNNILCVVASNSCKGIYADATFAGSVMDNFLIGQSIIYTADMENHTIFRSQIFADFGTTAGVYRTSAWHTNGVVNTKDKAYKIFHTNDGLTPNTNITANIGDICVVHQDGSGSAQLIWVCTVDNSATSWVPVLLNGEGISVSTASSRNVLIGTTESGHVWEATAQVQIGQKTTLSNIGNTELPIVNIGGQVGSSQGLWRRDSIVRDPAGGAGFATARHIDALSEQNNADPLMPLSLRTARTWWDRYPNTGAQMWGDQSTPLMTLDGGGNLQVNGTITATNAIKNPTGAGLGATLIYAGWQRFGGIITLMVSATCTTSGISSYTFSSYDGVAIGAAPLRPATAFDNNVFAWPGTSTVSEYDCAGATIKYNTSTGNLTVTFTSSSIVLNFILTYPSY